MLHNHSAQGDVWDSTSSFYLLRTAAAAAHGSGVGTLAVASVWAGNYKPEDIKAGSSTRWAVVGLRSWWAGVCVARLWCHAFTRSDEGGLKKVPAHFSKAR